MLTVLREGRKIYISITFCDKQWWVTGAEESVLQLLRCVLEHTTPSSVALHTTQLEHQKSNTPTTRN